jgi:hypothetical protein
MDEMTDRERAAEYYWQLAEARAKVVRLTDENKRLERLLAYANEALKGEVERANAAERAALRRGVD